MVNEKRDNGTAGQVQKKLKAQQGKSAKKKIRAQQVKALSTSRSVDS